MPSTPSSLLPPAISPPQRTNHHHIHLNHRILVPLIAGILTITIIGILVLVIFLYRKLSYNRTAPFDQTQQSSGTRRFSYSLLRRATGAFSATNRLGHGGFGSVYKASLPSGQSLAVKVMDSQGSIQGEREFYNELSLASNLNHPHILALFGFATDRRGKKLILVYELMPNRSLQEALLDRKCIELMEWKRRFRITLDIAKGLEYLHCFCNPPVIHGDIKPSNVLLDSDFNAKIGDFGLARTKTEDPEQIGHVVLEVEEEMEEIEGNQKKKKKREESVEIGEENGSIMEEMESASLSVSVMTGGFEDGCVGIDQSPESSIARALDSEASPENMVALSLSPETAGDKMSGFDGVFDKFSVDSKKNLIVNGKRRGGSGRDWWWKQDNGIGSESGRIKDYVMEWIGNEIKKERPKNEWVASPSSLEIDGGSGKFNANTAQKKRRKKLEWWASLDEDKFRKKDKNRKPREWWKEEFCDELSKKKRKKRRGMNLSNGGEFWWQKDEDEVQEKKKKKSKSKSSRGSIDWWLDGLSGELRSGRRNSQDWTSCEIPKSGGISSTPSMRGTVCYVAPEYGGGGQLSEKCDVYSFGVLILVLISGRRPLQVMASPMSEFERANLISWARQLARNGKLLDLVDPSILSLNKEEALLCLTIALLCLQRTPAKRPSMKEIVEMLSGESEPPHLPFEFSPSPPSNFSFKSRKKAR